MKHTTNGYGKGLLFYFLFWTGILVSFLFFYIITIGELNNENSTVFSAMWRNSDGLSNLFTAYAPMFKFLSAWVIALGLNFAYFRLKISSEQFKITQDQLKELNRSNVHKQRMDFKAFLDSVIERNNPPTGIPSLRGNLTAHKLTLFLVDSDFCDFSCLGLKKLNNIGCRLIKEKDGLTNLLEKYKINNSLTNQFGQNILIDDIKDEISSDDFVELKRIERVFVDISNDLWCLFYGSFLNTESLSQSQGVIYHCERVLYELKSYFGSTPQVDYFN